MWTSLDFGTPGYAEAIKEKLIKGASQITYLHPYDYMALKIQSVNMVGFYLEGSTATIELGIDHPQGFGNYFVTELYKNSSTKQGQPTFVSKYPDEEFLGYSIDAEDGYLLTEDGEMIVLA